MNIQPCLARPRCSLRQEGFGFTLTGTAAGERHLPALPPGTPLGHPWDTPGTLRDTTGTPLGHPGTLRDTTGTPPGHHRDTPGTPRDCPGLPGTPRDSSGLLGTPGGGRSRMAEGHWWKLTFLRKRPAAPAGPYESPEGPAEPGGDGPGPEGPPGFAARLEKIVDKSTKGKHVKVSHSGRFKEKKKVRATLAEHPNLCGAGQREQE